MGKILKQEAVLTTITDQCMFGLTTTNWEGKRMPAKKKTRFMSNSEEIMAQLNVKCPGEHQHQMLIDGRAKKAAIYPPALCRAICKGLVEQIKKGKYRVKSMCRVTAETKVGEAPPEEET